MKRKTFFTVASILVVLLALSAFFAKKLNPVKDETPTHAPVVVAATPIPTPTNTPLAQVSPPSPSVQHPNCTIDPAYLKTRQELGVLVNDHATRLSNPALFVKNMQKWKTEHGLPLALQLDDAKASGENIVYNNCRPSCAGHVYQVFVSRVVGGKAVEVLDRSGKMKTLPLRTSGLEVSTLDEINKKGVPFRSWFVPSDNGPWFIKGNDIYIGLDIEGLQLKIGSRGDWTVVAKDVTAVKLTETEAVKVPGCTADDLCLVTEKNARRFRAPKPCSPVVRHALDSVTEPREN